MRATEANFAQLGNQGYEAFTEGDFETAEERLTAALEMAETLNIQDIRLASVLNSLSGVYGATGREAEALEPCIHAFRIMEQACEPGDSDLFGVAQNIARIQEKLGNPDEALQWAKRAYEIAGGNIKAQGEAALAYSDALLQASRAQEAAAILSSTCEGFLAFLAGAENSLALMTDPLAEMIKEEYRLEKREPPLLLKLRINLAKARHALGQADGSIASLPEMGTFEARTHGEDSKELGMKYQELGVALHLLAQATHQRAHFAKADEYYQRSFKVLEKACEADDPDFEDLQANMQELQDDVSKL
jgi:tetratricopeptide (TPR) repeat protein